MTVVGDSREPNHPFEQEELPCGDYVITGTKDSVIIERKEWTDLISSMRSGSLYQQLRMCREQDDYRVVLLIEGSRSNALRYANAKNYEIRRFLSSFVAKSPDVNLVFTRDFDETCDLVEDIDDWLNPDNEDRVHSVRPTEKVPEEKRPQFIVEGLPSVGPQTADAILSEFDNVQQVFTASKEDLQEVDGIGPKTAEKIREAICR